MVERCSAEQITGRVRLHDVLLIKLLIDGRTIYSPFAQGSSVFGLYPVSSGKLQQKDDSRKLIINTCSNVYFYKMVFWVKILIH